MGQHDGLITAALNQEPNRQNLQTERENSIEPAINDRCIACNTLRMPQACQGDGRNSCQILITNSNTDLTVCTRTAIAYLVKNWLDSNYASTIKNTQCTGNCRRMRQFKKIFRLKRIRSRIWECSTIMARINRGFAVSTIALRFKKLEDYRLLEDTGY